MGCINSKQIQTFIKNLLKDEAEGVVLRRKASFYIPGRSDHLLKFKATRGDLEALVIGTNEKAIELQLPNEVIFTVPRARVRVGVKRGEVVTVAFEDFASRGEPSRPQVVRVRSELSWEEVVVNYNNDSGSNSLQTALLNMSSHNALEAMKPHGYWIANKGHNMRVFFEKVAKRNNLDPLIPESWYGSLPSIIEQTKGSKSVVRYFNGSVVKAVLQLFPEIGLEENKFLTIPLSHWKNVGNRRKYLEEFARDQQFDPLIPSNWYSLIPDTLTSKKGATLILRYYGLSYERAVMHLFPEIGLVKRNFVSLSHYRNRKVVRNFFIQIGKSQGFDPLIPDNWYSISKNVVSGFRDARNILQYFRGSFVLALLQTFPNIGLEKSKFSHLKKQKPPSEEPKDTVEDNTVEHADYLNNFPELKVDSSKFNIIPRGHWADARNRKAFFEEFAKENGFDSSIASNWYSVTKQQLNASKSANSVFHYYKGSFIRSLQDIYPNLNLDANKFTIFPKHYWSQSSNRRQYFVDLAIEKGFDPLVAQNWYSLPSFSIKFAKGLAKVINHHNGKYEEALVDLFPELGLDRSKFML